MKKVLLGLLALVVIAASVMVAKIGPRNVIGMLRYDTRREGNLKVGDRAPDVLVLSLDGKTQQPLLTGDTSKPTVLIFGSFTWPPFRRSVDRLRQMYARYGDRVNFRTIYIREAHPLDEWQMESNEKEDVCYKQPKTIGDRVAIANDFVKRFKYPIPLAVDTMANYADTVYAGWPERFYILNRKGTIVYKGETGPFGFHPEEVEAWLAKGRYD